MTSYSGSVMADLDDISVSLNSSGNLQTINGLKLYTYISQSSTNASTSTLLAASTVPANTFRGTLLVDARTFLQSDDQIEESCGFAITINGSTISTGGLGARMAEGTPDISIRLEGSMIAFATALTFSNANTVSIYMTSASGSRAKGISGALIYGV